MPTSEPFEREKTISGLSINSYELFFMNYSVKIFSFLLLILFFNSCKQDHKSIFPEEDISENPIRYLHISHTRTNANPNLDSIVEAKDFSKYDMLWLGGDLAESTSLDVATMNHVDSIFDLANPNTLWALGNHDYDDLQRVRSYTLRETYNVYYKNGITILVLDTQDSLSNIIGMQKQFVEAVLDTIAASSHLIILTHKLIWMYGDSILEPQIQSITNGGFGLCFYCLNPNNFYTTIYPQLLAIQNRGVKVICIAGDIGFYTKEFSYVNSDGMTFLASGINAGTNGNKALLFSHNKNKKTLTWSFVPLMDL